MDRSTKNYLNKYERVMSCIRNRSRTSLRSDSIVTRHELPSARVRGKSSVSSANCGVFNELPTVLSDYVPDNSTEKVARRTFVSKPRKTLKSLDPAESPHRAVQTVDKVKRTHPSVKLESEPCVKDDKCVNMYERQCLSSRSCSNLKNIKEEIKAYNEAEKLMKLRSNLYKKCGVVLDDVGQVTEDKAVQADPIPDTTTEKSPTGQVTTSRRAQF